MFALTNKASCQCGRFKLRPQDIFGYFGLKYSAKSSRQRGDVTRLDPQPSDIWCFGREQEVFLSAVIGYKAPLDPPLTQQAAAVVASRHRGIAARHCERLICSVDLSASRLILRRVSTEPGFPFTEDPPCCHLQSEGMNERLQTGRLPYRMMDGRIRGASPGKCLRSRPAVEFAAIRTV